LANILNDKEEAEAPLPESLTKTQSQKTTLYSEAIKDAPRLYEPLINVAESGNQFMLRGEGRKEVHRMIF